MSSEDPYFGTDPLEGGFGLPGSYGSGAPGDPKSLAFAPSYLDDLEDAFVSTNPDMDTDASSVFAKPQQPYESPFAPSTADPGPASLSAKNVRSLPSFVPTFDTPFQSGLGPLPSGPSQWKPSQPPQSLSSSTTTAAAAGAAGGGGGWQMGGMAQDSFGALDETASIMSSDSSVGLAGSHLPPWQSDQSLSSGVGGMALASSKMGLEDLPSVKRRAERNAREQKRSLKITEQISHLKDVLASDGRTVKNSKMAILMQVEDYIKELEGQVAGRDVGGESAFGGGGATLEMDMGQLDVSGGSMGVQQGGSGIQVTPGVDYRTLFRHTCVPMAVASIDGRFLDSNSRFEGALGMSTEELKALTFFNILDKEELQDAFTTVALMLQGLTQDTVFTRSLEGKPGRQRMYITVSLLRAGSTPKHFNCSLHV